MLVLEGLHAAHVPLAPCCGTTLLTYEDHIASASRSDPGPWRDCAPRYPPRMVLAHVLLGNYTWGL